MSSPVQDQPAYAAAQTPELAVEPSSRPLPARLPRSYVAAWVAAAALSGSYLTATALTGIGGSPPDATAQDGTVRAVETAEARAMKYKVSLEDFQRDVGLLRTELASRSSDTALVARLAALEERLSIETGVAIAKFPAAVPPDSPAAVATAPEPAASQLMQFGQAATSPSGTGVAPSPTRVAGAVATIDSDGQPRMSIPLETGSLQKSPDRTDPTRADQPRAEAKASIPAVASTSLPNSTGTPAAPTAAAPAIRAGTPPPAGPVILNAAPAAATAKQVVQTAPTDAAAAIPPAPPPPPPKPFAVQLTSGGSVESLRLSWSVLSEQHGDTLRPLEPRVSKSAAAPGASPIYDLLAGPFKTAADARKACKTLATRGVDCKVGNFGGQSL